MSRQRSETPRASQRPAFSWGAAACVVLIGASVVNLQRELHLTRAAERFARRFSIDRRWSGTTTRMRGEPSSDLASAVVVEASLKDLRDGVNAGVGAPAGGAEIELASQLDEELRSARELMLAAIAARPGWTHHWLLLGQVVHEAARRPGHVDLRERPELWADPLRQAAVNAPGLDAAWVALANAYLDTWPQLSPGMRRELPAILRRAFLDRDFVARALPSASAAIGHSQALSLLPDIPFVLDVATRSLALNGDIPGAALVAARRERVEKRKRATDLLLLEEKSRLGDRDDLLVACQEWISKHRVAEQDDRIGRAQAARVLELWPAVDPGPWRDDPRGKLVRFFLDGRESDVSGQVLVRSLESLSGVPLPVMARARLLAGHLAEAQELASPSNVATDPSTWVPYFVQLARFELTRGRAQEARAALERIPTGAEEQCEILLTHRDVARVLRDSTSEEILNRKIDAMRMRSHSAEAVAGTGQASLPLCLERDWAKKRVLIVEIEVVSPAVLAYGWNGGRSGTVEALESSTIFRVPLDERSGGSTFWVRATAGGPVRELRAVAEPVNEPGSVGVP